MTNSSLDLILFENMTEDQLDAMSGSETLRYHATSFGITRNNKALIKSTNSVRYSFFPKDEPKLVVPLLLLIAQHGSVLMMSSALPTLPDNPVVLGCGGVVVDFLAARRLEAPALWHQLRVSPHILQLPLNLKIEAAREPQSPFVLMIVNIFFNNTIFELSKKNKIILTHIP